MARGDAPMPLEQLVPYYRGARIALLAMRMRHPENQALGEDVERYVAMLQRFEAALVATHRLRRQIERR